MTLLLTPDQSLTTLGAALRTTLDGSFARARAQGRAALPADNLLRDPTQTMPEARQWVLDRLRELVEHGPAADGVPHSAGELGSPQGQVVAFELLSHGDLSVTIKSGVQFGLFAGAVGNLGTEWHRDTYLERIRSLDILGCFAMTELGHGSDVQSLETTITFDPETDEFVVHTPVPAATKAYIGNAGLHGSMAVVFGQLVVSHQRHGVHAILVPIRDEAGRDLPGVTTADQGHKGGLVGVDNGTISFDQLRVPRRMLLDRYGGVDADGRYTSSIESPNRRFFTMVGTLVRGRVCISAGAGIAARRGISIATRYALKRRQFPAPGRSNGVLLLDYLTHQRRLLPLVARSYALGFAQNNLNELMVKVQGGAAHTDADQRELETWAAGLKSITTSFANSALQTCREACGGAGFMSENQLTALRSDVDIFATFEGDNTVLLQLVTKSLLGDYRQVWGELDRAGVVQATARAVGDSVMEWSGASVLLERLTSAARRQPDQLAMVDRSWQALMFTERERHSVESLARRMRAAAKSDGDHFEASNRLGDHVLFVARAYLERRVFDAFLTGVDGCADREARQVLERLLSLYALSSLDADRAWFVEHNRMSTARSKAIGEQLSSLCRELRPHALPLVEGLGIPEAWLGARLLES
ncbi:MAG: acyl-CoA dehydrogenase [Propionicimonas sp.]|nr:acyl-CoA dehydrogenase [Propionicimonas sp.]